MTAGRPRVAQLIPTLSLGGATALVIELSARLRRDGYETHIVTGDGTESGVSMKTRTRDLGIPVHVLPSFRRDPSPLHDARALGQLTALLRDHHFRLLHGHGTKSLLLGAWAAHRAGIPSVWHVHGWGFHDGESWLSRAGVVWAHRLLARKASRVAAVSEATKAIGLSNRIGSERDYCVIYEAVDLERFAQPPLPQAEAKVRLGIDPDRLVVGSLTRLSPQKAPTDLVDAAATVLRDLPDVSFYIAGDGPLMEATLARVRRHGIEDQVVLPGARWDVPEVLAAFDVFALTSLWEGFPICYLEAMAMGKPVVGTDAGGAAEAILDGETGFCVPRSSPHEVARRIVELLGDQELRTSMGVAGRKHAAQYGYDRLLRDVSALYQQLLNNGRRPSDSHIT